MSFNVLIVDDSQSMRAVVKKIISISGFRMDGCYEAGNGLEALEVLAKDWIDVILTDINMPEMGGLELLARLQGDELYKDIPVIVITTEGSSERMEEAFRSGAKGFIKKPFLPEDVKKILHKVVGVSDDGQYQEDRGDDDGGDF